MMDAIKVVSDVLDMGGNGALIFAAVWIIRTERRVHNLEIVTGIKKLVGGDT